MGWGYTGQKKIDLQLEKDLGKSSYNIGEKISRIFSNLGNYDKAPK